MDSKRTALVFIALAAITACDKLKASAEGTSASASAAPSAPTTQSTGSAAAGDTASAAATATATLAAAHGGKAVVVGDSGTHLQNGEKKVDFDTNADGGKLTLHNDAGTGSIQYGSSSGMTLKGASGKTLTIPGVK